MEYRTLYREAKTRGIQGDGGGSGKLIRNKALDASPAP